MGRSEGFRALERIRDVALDEKSPARTTRKEFLGTVAAGALATSAWARAAQGAPAPPDVRVAIVGAGLAGLACADVLKQKGIRASVFDANDRVGGRCFSLRGFFPGQVAERGGEFIDTGHTTMRGYANRFGLELEDVTKVPGETFYFVDGNLYPEAQVVDELRALVPAMRRDLQTSSGAPTADSHTEGDVRLDFTNMKEWLVTRGAGGVIAGVIEAAYIGEYGREIDEQSCLNLLLFIHADRRSKFTPFGVFSDERFHVVDGNDAIPAGLARELDGQIELGQKLVAAGKDGRGRIVLTLFDGTRTTSRAFDAVVLALPFTALRDVDIRGLELPAWKLDAIRNLVYGDNAKLLVGFDGRPWQTLGGDGQSYANGLPHLQGTWETNASGATATRAVLTDYTGGRLGKNLNPQNPALEADRFLSDLDSVFAGASARASRDARGRPRADLWHWPSLPLWQGSYTCNHPGYFTTIAGNEGKPVGNVYFAGEHTNSFYVWQGFMEGAAVSGLDAANQILADLKRRA